MAKEAELVYILVFLYASNHYRRAIVSNAWSGGASATQMTTASIMSQTARNQDNMPNCNAL